MMKIIYNRICLPLFFVNNNVYSFLSGILVSLATNIFTTLCFESEQKIAYYLASIFFVVSSAICLYIATKVSGIQNYIEKFNYENKKKILKDATKGEYRKWALIYLELLISIIVGVLFLSYYYWYPILGDIFIKSMSTIPST